MSGLRSAVEEAEALVVLLPDTVDIEASFDLIPEVAGDRAGVVLNPDLPDPGDTEQQVLVVDERLVSQGRSIVPLCPVEAVQQRALGELFVQRKCLISTFLYVSL